MRYILYYCLFCPVFQFIDIVIVNMVFRKKYRRNFKFINDFRKNFFSSNGYLHSVRIPIMITIFVAILVASPVVVPIDIYKKIKRLIVGKTDIEKRADELNREFEEQLKQEDDFTKRQNFFDEDIPETFL